MVIHYDTLWIYCYVETNHSYILGLYYTVCVYVKIIDTQSDHTNLVEIDKFNS